MRSFSASEAAFEGFRILRDHPGAVAAWALASALGQLAFGGAFFALFGAQFASLAQYSGATTMPPEVAMRLVGSMFGAILLVTPLALFFGSIFLSGVMRVAIRPQDKGLFYLKIGGDEWRVFLFLLAWVGLFFVGEIGLAILFTIVIGVFAVALAASHTQPVWIGLIDFLIVLALLGTMIWLLVRMSLGAAMSFAEKRVRVFGSWGLTRGRFWPLLGCYLLAAIFGIVVSIVGAILSTAISALLPGHVAGWTPFATGGAAVANGVAVMAQMFSASGIVRIVISSLFGTLANLILIAPTAAVYRALASTEELDVFSDAPAPVRPTGGLVL